MMNKTRKKKLNLLLLVIIVLALFVALVLYALRQNINLFYSPTEILHSVADTKRIIRLGGVVVEHSVQRNQETLEVQFQLTDFNQTVEVHYQGLLPDLFREGQGIIALGVMDNNHHFRASQVLAKHDANYMPPILKTALDHNKRG